MNKSTKSRQKLLKLTHVIQSQINCKGSKAASHNQSRAQVQY